MKMKGVGIDLCNSGSFMCKNKYKVARVGYA